MIPKQVRASVVVTAVMTALALGAGAGAQTPDRAVLANAVKADHDAAIERLRAWIALPTVAAEKRAVDKGAPYLRDMLLDTGFQHAEVVPTKGVPGVFATLDAGARQCVGLYFMYDVKQFDPAEWSSPPLEGRIIDRPGVGGVMIGRGVANQKGPETAFLSAVRAFKATGRKLPVNLVLVAEGEEEIASPHFREVVTKPQVAAALGKCIGVFIPTPGQTSSGAAEISLGAKGAVELQLIAGEGKWERGPTRDIHSGFAASVDSPAWHLVQALNTLVGPDGHTPAVPGWADRVRPLTARQEQLVAQNGATENEADVKRQLGVRRWIEDEDFLTSQKRLIAQPTINIEGLVSGYTGAGGKSILPGRAEAKLDLRLVPDMTPEDVVAKLRNHLQAKGFGDIQVNVSGGYGPNQTDETSGLTRAEQATFRRAGVPFTLVPRIAGSWPGVVFTGAPLRLAAGQFGLGRGGAAHAPDEWYLIDSSNPKIAGFDESAMFYVDFLYEAAKVAPAPTRK